MTQATGHIMTKDMLVELTRLQSNCSLILPNKVGAFLTVFNPEKTNQYIFTLAIDYIQCGAAEPQKVCLGSFSSIQAGLDFTNRMLQAILDEDPEVIFGLKRDEKK